MTDQLKSYLIQHKNVIEAERFDTLQSLCPLNLRRELVIFLLECSHDTSVIVKDIGTRRLEDEVKKYLPDVEICYCWLSYNKNSTHSNSNIIRTGSIKYVAFIHNKIIDSTSTWSSDSPNMIRANIIIKYGAESLAKDIQDKLDM